MNVKIYKSRFILEHKFSGSKSLTHRYLIGAFLLNNGIILDNIAINDDITATLNFFKALQKEIVFTSNNSLYIKPSKELHFDTLMIDSLASASTLRFLLPLSLNFAKKVIFNCDASLINRPLDIYLELMNKCNLSIVKNDKQIICSGSINLDYYEIDGGISSQFITGLIINALYLKKAITIKVIKNFYSIDYVKMTIAVFNKLGYDIEFLNDDTIIVHQGKNELLWDNYFIEGDYSTASNFIALSCLNGSLTSYNLKENSLQADYKIIEILKQMGGNIRFINENKALYSINNSLLLKGIAKQLKAVDVDIANCIDLGPILMVVASFANGTSHFKNVDRLKIKESNRLKAMIDNLTLLNVNIKYKDNEVIITGKKEYFNNVTLNSFNDHRIAMALSVFALLNNGIIIIKDAQCVKKSEPDFFEILKKGCKENAICYE